MAKRKNKKADKPMYTGRIMFDGNMQVKLLTGEVKTIRTDLCGMGLRKADPNKELLVLCRFFTNYNEIHTGYIVRMKQYDDCEQPCFGLKHEPNSESWTVVNYADVIAWGYADGGLNDPTLFYSCQSTVAEEIDRERRRAEKGIKTHAERLAEMDAEEDDELYCGYSDNQGIVFKFKHDDGYIKNEVSWPKTDGKLCVPDNLLPLQKATVDYFAKIQEECPDIKEVHFFTEPNEWESDSEDPEQYEGTTDSTD